MKMKKNTEIEEGEICYYTGDDEANIDPDSFSYIDEKIQHLLGHFRKDFEGVVSAENLGAKFGGYGSFLPTQERSPCSHSRAPQRNHSSPKLNINIHMEAVSHRTKASSNVLPARPKNASHNSHSFRDLKEASVNDSVKKEQRISSNDIIQDMTSFPIIGGVLISPLHESLVCMIKNEKVIKDSKYLSSLQGHQDTCSMSTDESDSFVGDQVIVEDWVCCDSCQKWRLLPNEVKPKHLPEKWLCSMLNWLPGMNSCDFSEDETTKAIYASQIPISDGQNNVQNHGTEIAIGVNDMNLHPADLNPMKKMRSAKHLSRLDNMIEEENMPKEKEKQVNEGYRKHAKLKRKMDADQYKLGTPKKPKISNNAGVNHSSGNFAPDQQHTLSSPLRINSSQTVADTLDEAAKLKDRADNYKIFGFDFESNMTYFQAGLMFLHGASLLENCRNESSKHGETSPMQIFATAAKLFKCCAHEYETSQEMAAAALAYKCMEVAYMRVVYCKSSSANRDRHKLQATLQLVSQVESPSSSASEVDNLNNQAAVDKATLPRGTNVAINQVISAGTRPNLVRLLDFTQDIHFAMEASRKCQSTFGAVNVIMQGARNKDCIASIRSVIDFSFQNVDELIRLVWTATKAISRAGLGGTRD